MHDEERAHATQLPRPHFGLLSPYRDPQLLRVQPERVEALWPKFFLLLAALFLRLRVRIVTLHVRGIAGLAQGKAIALALLKDYALQL